jgi:hypothetical protein
MNNNTHDQGRKILYWLLVNYIIGITISLLPLFFTPDELRIFATLISGEMTDPMGLYSFIAFLFLVWRVVLIWNYSKTMKRHIWETIPLYIVSPFNFGAPIIVIYMALILYFDNTK